MKKTSKLIAGMTTIAMLSALSPMTAFAAEITPETDPPEGGLKVTYDVAPSYTVTIPAGVDITTEDKYADITLAEGALLEEGSSIEVKLIQGDFTTSGSVFHAKNAKGGSTASYGITKGTGSDAETISVGDVVATLNKDTRSSTLTFSKTPDIAPTYAGEHSEVLTFSISLEDAPSVTVNSISLNRDSLVLGAGRTDIVANALRATVNKEPNDAEVTVKWTSSEPTVASVDENGKITPLVIGETTITAEAGGKTATCNVEVVENKLTTINVQREDDMCIDGVTFSYMPGDTYRQAVDRNSHWNIYDFGSKQNIYYDYPSGDLYVNGGSRFPGLGYAIDDVVDPYASYSHDIWNEDFGW